MGLADPLQNTMAGGKLAQVQVDGYIGVQAMLYSS